MAESEIPADIRAKALAVSLCHQEPRGCVHPNDNSCGDGCELYAAIAKALLAERERCAKIAMTRRSTPSRDMDQYGTTLAIDIASAIRQDKPNETEQRNG